MLITRHGHLLIVTHYFDSFCFLHLRQLVVIAERTIQRCSCCVVRGKRRLIDSALFQRRQARAYLRYLQPIVLTWYSVEQGRCLDALQIIIRLVQAEALRFRIVLASIVLQHVRLQVDLTPFFAIARVQFCAQGGRVTRLHHILLKVEDSVDKFVDLVATRTQYHVCVVTHACSFVYLILSLCSRRLP